MVGAPLKQSFRPTLQIMRIIQNHGPLSRQQIYKKATEEGICKFLLSIRSYRSIPYLSYYS